VLTAVGKPAGRAQGKPARSGLSYKDQRELGSLPAKIESLEMELSELQETMSSPGFYQSDKDEIQRVSKKLAEVEKTLETSFDRWNELEEIAQ